MRELEVAICVVACFRDFDVLDKINEIHVNIQTFFFRFRKVSARWLYLTRMIQMARCFDKNPKRQALYIQNNVIILVAICQTFMKGQSYSMMVMVEALHPRDYALRSSALLS